MNKTHITNILYAYEYGLLAYKEKPMHRKPVFFSNLKVVGCTLFSNYTATTYVGFDRLRYTTIVKNCFNTVSK